MRYMFVTYYRKADGKIDEATAVSNKVKLKDTQMVNVILDFRDLKVIKCSLEETVVPKEWDRIVSFYYQHYPSIIERLFTENGHTIVEEATQEAQRQATQAVSDH
jgi:hypothetical protein